MAHVEESEPAQSNGHIFNNDDNDDDERGKMRPADIDAVSDTTNLNNLNWW